MHLHRFAHLNCRYAPLILKYRTSPDKVQKQHKSITSRRGETKFAHYSQHVSLQLPSALPGPTGLRIVPARRSSLCTLCHAGDSNPDTRLPQYNHMIFFLTHTRIFSVWDLTRHGPFGRALTLWSRTPPRSRPKSEGFHGGTSEGK